MDVWCPDYIFHRITIVVLASLHSVNLLFQDYHSAIPFTFKTNIIFKFSFRVFFLRSFCHYRSIQQLKARNSFLFLASERAWCEFAICTKSQEPRFIFLSFSPTPRANWLAAWMHSGVHHNHHISSTLYRISRRKKKKTVIATAAEVRTMAVSSV